MKKSNYERWLQRRDPELYRQLQEEARHLDEMQWLRNAWQGAKNAAKPLAVAGGVAAGMLGGVDGSSMMPYAQAPTNINYTVDAGEQGVVGNQAGIEQDLDTKGGVQVGSQSQVIEKGGNAGGGDTVMPGINNMTVAKDKKGRVTGTWDGRLGMTTQRPEIFQGSPGLFSRGQRVNWEPSVRQQFNKHVGGAMNNLVPGSGDDVQFSQQPQVKGYANDQEYAQMRKQAYGEW